jgi:hypothetical protein
MRVFEEREKKHLSSVGKNIKLLVAEPPRSLFKVVVNNYIQHDNEDEEIVDTVKSDQQGLPPQAAGYLKFPEYDWF